MRKLVALFVALLFLTSPAHALTGKVLYIVCDKLGIAQNTSAFAVNNIVARCQEVQAWEYETCMSSDTTFLGSLYADNPTIAGAQVGSRYGRYDIAVMLNMPLPSWIKTDANCDTYGMPHFLQMVDRNHTWASPIPLLVMSEGFPEVNDTTRDDWRKFVTGCHSTTALTAGLGFPYKDAGGDSLYTLTPTGREEALVFDSDTTMLIGSTLWPTTWVKPLFWRSTTNRDASGFRYASCWMTVGTGNHRVIWLPWATDDCRAGMVPIIFSMFTKVRPIELPIIAYAFGRININGSETGKDTVLYGAGFKAVKDYAVANGMKVELACYPYRMKLQGVAANTTTAVNYATQYPQNIRLTMSSGESWFGTTYYDMKGSANATIYTTTVVAESSPNRIKRTQDSCAVYYPIINTAILDGYDGIFSAASTYNKADSILMALANRNLTDVYNWWTPAYSVAYPASVTYQIVGPQRTWINSGGTLKEIRFHSINNIARYNIQELDNPDWLKTAYYDTVGTDKASYKRAQFMSLMLPRMLGLYVYIDGAEYSVRGAAAKGARAMATAKYSTGIYLPALTFSGGSKLSWAGTSKATRRAAVDSTRSVFLDVMKMVNNQKKMGDYLVQTYGINGTTPFIYSWMSDVKWDRRNGQAFSNSHASME